MTRAAVLDNLKRPRFLIGIAVIVVVVVVWLFAFFIPQGHKLSTIQAEETTLHQTVAQDDLKVQQLATVSRHYPQILARYNQLQAFAPATEDLYTYIETISQTATSSGIVISSISPGALTAVVGAPYSSLSISVNATGTYDHMLEFIKTIYGLPRLTDIETLNIGGGGISSTRTSPLTLSFSLVIFTQEKAANGAAG